MKKIDFSSLDERLDAKVDSIRRRIGAAFYYPEAKALEANIKASEACIKRLENELERLRAALDQKNEEIAIKDKQHQETLRNYEALRSAIRQAICADNRMIRR